MVGSRRWGEHGRRGHRCLCRRRAGPGPDARVHQARRRHVLRHDRGLPHHRGPVVTGSDDGADAHPARVRCPEAGRGLSRVSSAPHCGRSSSSRSRRPCCCSSTAPVIAPLLVGSANADYAQSMLRTLSVFVPVAALNDSVLAATRGLGSMRPTVFVENLGRLVAQPIAVIVVAAIGLGPTALVFALGGALRSRVGHQRHLGEGAAAQGREPATPPSCSTVGPRTAHGTARCDSSSGSSPLHGRSRPWSRPHSGAPTW